MERYMRGMSNGGAVRAKNGEALTEDQLRRFAPSIFADSAHESRSQRFAPIPTFQVLTGLQAEGFQPVFAQQARTRIEGKELFTKHLIRMRHQSRTNTQGEAHEIILLNANDGTSAYKLMSGVFRFLCMNGLMVGDTFAKQNVRHSGDVQGKVIEGAYEVLDQSEAVMGSIDEMKSICLKPEEKQIFANAVHMLRYDDQDAAPIEPAKLLTPRRSADRGDDLWKTFNVAQENVIRGRQRGAKRDAQGILRPASSRAVSSLDKASKLNQAIWTLTEQMQALKAA